MRRHIESAVKRALGYGSCAAVILGCAVWTGEVLADEVRLKNGGRVRGTVVEEIPKSHVKIRLADGTMKDVPWAEVDKTVYDEAPAPPAPTPPAPAPLPPVAPPPAPEAPSHRLPSVANDADNSGPDRPRSPVDEPEERHVETGTVNIVTEENGDAFSKTYRAHDFKPQGKVSSAGPLSLQLPAGHYRVKVEFDEGADGEKIWVQPGETQTIKLFSAKESLKHLQFFMSFGGPDLILPFAGGARVQYRGGGFSETYGVRPIALSLLGSVTAGVKIPIHDRIELRTVVHGAVGGGNALTGMVRFEGIFRFGIGSVYGVEVGPALGGLFTRGAYQYEQSKFFVLGPKWSVLSLRMGPHRNIGLNFDQGILLAFHGAPSGAGLMNEDGPSDKVVSASNYTAAYEQSVNLSFLTL